jgi:hypothetical protein
MKNFYQNQQNINDTKLSKRIDSFLKRLATFKQQKQSGKRILVYQYATKI